MTSLCMSLLDILLYPWSIKDISFLVAFLRLKEQIISFFYKYNIHNKEMKTIKKSKLHTT